MIKTIIHFSTKVILAVTVYVLMLIVGILSLVGALFRTLSDVIGSVLWVCLGFMLSAAVALTIYFLVDKTVAPEVWRHHSIFIMWLLVALMTFCVYCSWPPGYESDSACDSFRKSWKFGGDLCGSIQGSFQLVYGPGKR